MGVILVISYIIEKIGRECLHSWFAFSIVETKCLYLLIIYLAPLEDINVVNALCISYMCNTVF